MLGGKQKKKMDKLRNDFANMKKNNSLDELLLEFKKGSEFMSNIEQLHNLKLKMIKLLYHFKSRQQKHDAKRKKL